MKASGSGRMPGNFSMRGEHVERRGIAVRVFARGERLGLLPPLAAGDVGVKLEQHVGGGRQRDAVGQHLAQRAPADREIGRGIERLDHGFDQRGIVGGKQAEGVADRVVETAFGQVELDVPGLLRGAGLVEPRARDEGRHRRIVARACRARPRASPPELSAAAVGLRRGRRRAESRHRATSASGWFPCRPARKGSAALRSCVNSASA